MSTPQPTTLSPAFRLIVGGVLLISALTFIIALHYSHRSELANIRENTDGWWMHQAAPTPQPTPKAMPTPRPAVHPAQQPVQPPRPTPMAVHTVSPLVLRYRRAIETGMGGDMGSNVRQLPQIVRASGQPGPEPTPTPTDIFSTFGAYPLP